MTPRDHIACPHCGHVADAEARYAHVTYWGSEYNEWSEYWCEGCGEYSEVHESVTRQWTVRKKAVEIMVEV
jgi:hypothetical protein